MTKKKLRIKLARALRREGITHGIAHRIARAVVGAGSPGSVSAEKMVALGLHETGGEFCAVRLKMVPLEVFHGATGGSVTVAWHAAHRRAALA